MPEGLQIALALPLQISRIPLTSLAVIAAIAVLVYEVRGFLRRSAADAPMLAASGATPSAPPRPAPPHPQPTEPARDRVTMVRAGALAAAEPKPLVEVAAAVHAQPRPSADAGLRAAPPSPLDAPPLRAAVTAEAAFAQAPIITPPTQAARSGGRGIDGRLAFAGAVVVGLTLLWLVIGSLRARS